MANSSSRSPASAACRGFVAVALVAMAVAGRGPALAGTEGPYPVWWSPALGLDSLEEIDRRLDKPLWNNLQGGIALYTIVEYVTVQAVADTCRSLRKLTAEGYTADSRNGAVIVEAHLHYCRAIELLGRARPARVSFVRNFAMDRNAVDVLPDSIGEGSCAYICEQIGSTEKGVSWSENERIDTVEQVDKTTIRVLEVDDPNKRQLFARVDLNSDGIMDRIWIGPALNLDDTPKNLPVIRTFTKVRLVGRADFDSDGVEDLMIIVSSWRSDIGRLSTSRFLLTRRSPYDAVLNISDYEGRECRASGCQPTSIVGPREE